MLFILYRLNKPIPYLCMYSKEELSNLPSLNDLNFTILSYFYKKAKENEFEDSRILNGLKIIFYLTLENFLYFDEKLFDEATFKIFKRDSRKKILNYILNLGFINEIEIEDSLYNFFKKKIENNYYKIREEIESLDKTLIKVKYEKSNFSELVFFSLEHVKNNILRKFIKMKVKSEENIEIKKGDFLSIILAFSLFNLFDYPEKILYEVILYYLGEKDKEFEKESQDLINIINNFKQIVNYSLKKEDNILKKKKNDSELELIKLLNIR
ncbi:MAG: hypothetical protein ABGW69_01220 [Nanoarchaeota archaeon]